MRRATESGTSASGAGGARGRRAIGAAVAATGLVVTVGIGVPGGTPGASAALTANAAAATISIDNPSVDGSYTATSMAVSFYDLSTGLGVFCSSTAVTVTGTVSSVSLQPLPFTIPDAITSLPVSTAGGCETLGIPVTVTTAALPYPLTFVNYPGEDSNGNAVNGDGYISIPAAAPVSVVIGTAGDPTSSCSFAVDGDATGWYENANGTHGAEMHMAPDIADDPAPVPLTIHNPTGDLCSVAGISAGDTGAFWATDVEPDTDGMTTDPFHVTPSVVISTP